MTHKELIAKMRSQPKYKEKYDEPAPEFESLRKMLKARKRAGLTSCCLRTAKRLIRVRLGVRLGM